MPDLHLIPIEPQPEKDNLVPWPARGCWINIRDERIAELCPHRVGDKLPVREAWRVCRGCYQPGVEYRDGEQCFSEFEGLADIPKDWQANTAWRPAASMPDWAVRRWQTVTRVEAVQWRDVWDEEAWAAEFVSREFLATHLESTHPITLTPDAWLWSVWAEEQEQHDAD